MIRSRLESSRRSPTHSVLELTSGSTGTVRHWTACWTAPTPGSSRWSQGCCGPSAGRWPSKPRSGFAVNADRSTSSPGIQQRARCSLSRSRAWCRTFRRCSPRSIERFGWRSTSRVSEDGHRFRWAPCSSLKRIERRVDGSMRTPSPSASVFRSVPSRSAGGSHIPTPPGRYEACGSCHPVAWRLLVIGSLAIDRSFVLQTPPLRARPLTPRHLMTRCQGVSDEAPQDDDLTRISATATCPRQPVTI